MNAAQLTTALVLAQTCGGSSAPAPTTESGWSACAEVGGTLGTFCIYIIPVLVHLLPRSVSGVVFAEAS